MRCNLHAHSDFSDGQNSPELLIEEAVSAGISHLAFADHFGTKKLPSSHVVTGPELEGYVNRLRWLGDANSKRLRLYVGIEIDFCPARTDFKGLVADGARRIPFENLDFVLFEYVGDASRRGAALEELLAMRPRFPCMAGLAHNNLAVNMAAYGPERLAGTLAEADIFVELHATIERPTRDEMTRYNLESDPILLRRPYYRRKPEFNDHFYRCVKQAGVGVSIGNDAHRFGRIDMALGDAWRFAAERGLEKNLIVARLDKARAGPPNRAGEMR